MRFGSSMDMYGSYLPTSLSSFWDGKIGVKSLTSLLLTSSMAITLILGKPIKNLKSIDHPSLLLGVVFSSRTWPFLTTPQPLRSFTIHNSAATDTKPALRGHNPSHNNKTTGSCHQMAWSSGGSWITNIANIDRLCFPIANELFTIILCPTNPITAKCN